MCVCVFCGGVEGNFNHHHDVETISDKSCANTHHQTINRLAKEERKRKGIRREYQGEEKG